MGVGDEFCDTWIPMAVHGDKVPINLVSSKDNSNYVVAKKKV